MRKTIALLLLLTAGSSQAAGWSELLTVEKAFTENSDAIVIYTSGGNGAYSSGCVTHHWVFTASSETRRARAWATILTALTTGQKLQLWFTDSCAVYSFHDSSALMLHKP
jgi:hypothetical protein